MLISSLLFRCVILVVLCFPVDMALAATTYTLGIAEENIGALDYEEGQFSGKMASATKCILDKIALDYTVVKAPHARLLKLLKEQQIDVAAPLVKTADRDTYATFIGALNPISMLLVYPKKFDNLTSTEFRQHVIDKGYVIKRGTHISPILSDTLGLPQSKMSNVEQQVLTFGDALDMVKLGRAACTIVPEMLLGAADQASLNDISFASQLTFYPSFYVANKQKSLLDRFIHATSACSSRQRQ